MPRTVPWRQLETEHFVDSILATTAGRTVTFTTKPSSVGSQPIEVALYSEGVNTYESTLKVCTGC